MFYESVKAACLSFTLNHPQSRVKTLLNPMRKMSDLWFCAVWINKIKLSWDHQIGSNRIWNRTGSPDCLLKVVPVKLELCEQCFCIFVEFLHIQMLWVPHIPPILIVLGRQHLRDEYLNIEIEIKLCMIPVLINGNEISWVTWPFKLWTSLRFRFRSHRTSCTQQSVKQSSPQRTLSSAAVVH